MRNKSLITAVFLSVLMSALHAQVNYSLSFDGTDDYVSISHNSVLNISSGTIAAYVKLDDITDNRYQ